MRLTSATIRGLLSTTLITVSPHVLGAQETEAFELDPIFVSAAGVGVDPLTAPASVTVVTGEEIQGKRFTDLTDAVTAEPGVFVDNNDNITFRGLRPEDTLILVDGMRVNTRQSRTNGSGGLDQFYVPPAAAIERIEIIRGPMSSLYGSEALGGVVNIITKPVGDKWTGSFAVEGTSPVTAADSADKQTSYFLSGPLVKDRLGLQIWGRRLTREEGVGAETSERDVTDTNAKLTWTPNANQEIFLSFGETTTTNETNGLRGSRVISTLRDDERRSLGLGYTGSVGTWDVKALLSREESKRETPTSSVGRVIEFDTTTFDVKASQELELHGLHQFTLGGQYQQADLTDLNLGSTTTTEHFTFSNAQWSVFAEDIWEVNDRLNLTIGARFTDDERFGGKVTPRLYATYALSPDLYLAGGISTGYKTPELRDANENYYLPTNGSRSGDAIQGNPDLLPEESTNYEIGLRFDNSRTHASATLFQTDFTNKIDNELVTVGGAPQGGDLYRYINLDKVRNRGLELSVGHELTPELEVSGSYTYIHSEQLSGIFAGYALNRTPEHQASLRLDWLTNVTGLAVWGQANYVGKASSVSETGTGGVSVTEYKDYTTLDIGLNYSVNDNLVLKAAIYNLGDAEINTTDHGTTQNGRTFWAGLTTQF